jgi:UDP-2,3-diacylglucosamine pyrophosphatase LpxH
MLSIAMDAYFRNEERVTVDCEPTYFKYLSHGKNLVGLTHGHGVKAADMPLMMATDVPKLWSAADYRVIFQGHVHHQSVKEFPGAVVESVRTLSATDAHHTLAGYRSARDLMNVVYEKNHGEIQRIRCGLSQLEALVA